MRAQPAAFAYDGGKLEEEGLIQLVEVNCLVCACYLASKEGSTLAILAREDDLVDDVNRTVAGSDVSLDHLSAYGYL